MEEKDYPKVKVREQDDQEDLKGSSLLSMNDDSFFPVKEYEDISPSYVAKIPPSYEPNGLLSTTSVSEEAVEDDKNSEELDRMNIRASSIPRPRAILSSPDNDVMIGNKGRMKVKQPSALKNHSLAPNRHAHCKVISSNTTEIPFDTRCSMDADDRKSDLRRNKGSAFAGSTQTRHHRNKKPSSVKT